MKSFVLEEKLTAEYRGSHTIEKLGKTLMRMKMTRIATRKMATPKYSSISVASALKRPKSHML